MGVFNRTRATPAPAPVAPAPAPAPGAAILPFRASRSLTAAASPINLADPKQIKKLARRRQGDAWQAEAWEYYDAIGEIKYAFSLVGNIMSRIRLYAGYVVDPSQPPTPADQNTPGGAAAIAALRKLDSAFGGQPGLLRDATLNLSVVGECYLVQRPGNPATNTPESWDIRSTDELEVSSDGSVYLKTREGASQEEKIKLPKNTFSVRIWRPHPRYSDEADSSMRGLLDACAELLLINRTFRATSRSRLNAGLLYLPDGLSVAAQPDPDAAADDTPDDDDEAGAFSASPSSLFDADDAADMDDFEEALLEAMTTPIADEESASAVVPLLVRGPSELGEKIRHITFERSFDDALTARADRVLERIMQGLDVPKDIVSGLAQVKYANAVVIDDALMRTHVEPLALLICDALTVGYLRPALKAAGVSPYEINDYVVWFDASAVQARPNRSEDAEKGYDNYALSAAAWRREHGFTDEDAPTPTELALRLLIEKATVTPELGEALLTVFAPEVMQRVREASQASNPAPLPPEVAQALGAPAAAAPGEPESGPAEPAAAPPAAPGTSTPTPPGAAPTPNEDLV